MKLFRGTLVAEHHLRD